MASSSNTSCPAQGRSCGLGDSSPMSTLALAAPGAVQLGLEVTLCSVGSGSGKMETSACPSVSRPQVV